MAAAAAPKTLLLLGILLTASLLLSSRATDAALDKETKGTTIDAAAGDNVVDSKQRCRCCRWAREGISGRLRCIECCRGAAQEDSAQVNGVSTPVEGTATDAAAGDSVVDSKQRCRCCRWAREEISGRLRCIECCRGAAQADRAQVDGEIEAKNPQN